MDLVTTNVAVALGPRDRGYHQEEGGEGEGRTPDTGLMSDLA
jgi:hypothetical protein